MDHGAWWLSFAPGGVYASVSASPYAVSHSRLGVFTFTVACMQASVGVMVVTHGSWPPHVLVVITHVQITCCQGYEHMGHPCPHTFVLSPSCGWCPSCIGLCTLPSWSSSPLSHRPGAWQPWTCSGLMSLCMWQGAPCMLADSWARVGDVQVTHAGCA